MIKDLLFYGVKWVRFNFSIMLFLVLLVFIDIFEVVDVFLFVLVLFTLFF